MDPVTLILTSLGAGASAGGQAIANDAIRDSYSGLKALIVRKFAGKPSAEVALNEHESDPKTWEAPLKKALMQEHVDQDQEIIEAAKKVMTQVQSQQAAMGKYMADETEQPTVKPKPPAGFGSTFNQYLWQRMNTADAKVGAIAAADLAFVTLFLPNIPLASFNILSASAVILWLIYSLPIGLFVGSAGVSFFTIFPRWKREADQGVIFWRSILNEYDGSKYKEKLQEDLGDLQAVEDAYAEENYRVCRNFARKNGLIQVSIWCFAFGSLSALLSLILRNVGVR
jgi:hypothetical protein